MHDGTQQIKMLEPIQNISSLNLSPQNLSPQNISKHILSSKNLSNYKTYLTTKLIKTKLLKLQNVSHDSHLKPINKIHESKISNHGNVPKIV